MKMSKAFEFEGLHITITVEDPMASINDPVACDQMRAMLATIRHDYEDDYEPHATLAPRSPLDAEPGTN